MDVPLKVGALSEATGLTIRTLHHYDEIGLLSPARRTPSGHRLYGEDEIRRLQRIASLKHLGLTLDEIRECLERPEYSLERVLDAQIERVEAELEAHGRTRDLLVDLRERVGRADAVPREDLLATIEATVTFARYYTSEQLERLADRRGRVGAERIQQGQEEWTTLLAAFEDAMASGADPAGAEVRTLAERSAALIEEFTGGDPGLLESLTDMYRSEGGEAVARRHGMSVAPGLWEYMRQAGAAYRGGVHR